MIGSICGHHALFRAQLDIYETSIPPQCQQFAEKILYYVKPGSLFSLVHKNDEKNCTAMFTSFFQQFQESCQPSNSDILWLHQFERIDCVGVKKLLHPTTRNHYYEPKVFFEFSLPSTATRDKQSQLLSYINNCDRDLVHDSHWPVCLGIIVNLHAQGFTFSLEGFYTVLDSDNKLKNARVTIFQGQWNTENISRLTFTIQRFVSIDQLEFELPMNLDKSLYVGNVIFTKTDNGNTTVMKVFDGRYREFPLKRNYQSSLQFIPNCKIYFQSDHLTIISYPFIEGTHYPKNSYQIISLLNSLINFHSQNYVLSDIRASNIVFGKDSSSFIDMDFCGKVDEIFYPESFRLEINDGKRHPDVQPGSKARQEHDCFSLGKMLELFHLADDSMQSLWSSILNEILNNNLQGALTLLSSHPPFEFESKAEDELSLMKFRGTGVTPQKK